MPKKKNKGGKKFPLTRLYHVAIALLVVSAFFWWYHSAYNTDKDKSIVPPAKDNRISSESQKTKKSIEIDKRKVQEDENLKIMDVRPKLAIIIDDLGYNAEVAASLLELDLRLTFAVLPNAPFKDLVIQDAFEKGCEVILHLPMEPRKHPNLNPEPKTLLISMEDSEILRIMDMYFKQMPGIVGVNNHMGSAFTENYQKMKIVLMELKRRNFFFIDSRTSSDSVGYSLAKKIGVSSAQRDVFIDNNLDQNSLRLKLEELMAKAKKSGSAIGICHPHPETLKLLSQYSSLLNSSFAIVCVSDIVKRDFE